ncbi:MAG TPA: haloacid dehalogenase-like hydrolase, partial [Planctomicrobium sp.]|nr:haloacid dehalogenase-like hydrolase [Planctomicrobium sp.]
MRNVSFAAMIVIISLFVVNPVRAADPLPSWNEGSAKSAILEFVKRTTTEGGNDFIPVGDRIAVFDNDGTLWCEQPAYFQLLFALDRIRELAPQHPEWKETEPFKSVLAGDLQRVAAQGEKGIAKIIAVTHAGMTSDEFNTIVRNWITTARHPKTGRLYTEMVYQPMLEILSYLRENEY